MKNVIKHIAKDGMNTWFTGGIWWMAGKDIEVGEWDADKQCAVITDENLVDITKDLLWVQVSATSVKSFSAVAICCLHSRKSRVRSSV